MSNNTISTIKTKLGYFNLKSKSNLIVSVYPTKNNTLGLNSDMHKEFEKEFNLYLNKKIKYFKFKCKPIGTDFQLKVWNEIKKIQYGSTKSYLDIANKINSSARAVGNACAKNTCLILIPCHRIICKNGDIGGFVMGKEIKDFLIRLEKNG